MRGVALLRASGLPALFALAVLGGCDVDGPRAADRAIRAEVLDAHLRFLAGDLLQGRAPGTRGGRLAAAYIENQLALAGLAPVGEAGGFMQTVPLVAASPDPELSFRARGGARYSPDYGAEYVAWAGTPDATTEANGELVFVGYGIAAPELGWDDYKGADVEGKAVLILVNDPDLAGSGIFRGDTLTYYGRWRYKLEEAARRGAVAAFLVHSPGPSGYGWNVVRSTWTGEQLSLEGEPAGPRPEMEGWLSRPAAQAVLSMAGLDFETLLESARSREFQPISTGVTVAGRVRSRVRRLSTANVAGLLRGGDPELAEEFVLYTAHYDHLGTGPAVDSDSIYNGAYDNASGVAVLLSMADAFTRLERRPSRSVLFLALTAEEARGLGSAYYVRHPLVPLERTVAAIDIDGANLWGRTQDVAVVGAELSSLADVAARAAESEGLRLVRGRTPEPGYPFRSDQLNFLSQGIPVAYVEHGLDYVGRMPNWGERVLQDYNRQLYHQPGDEYSEGLDLSGAVQQARVAFRIGLRVANAASAPTGRTELPFRADPPAAPSGGP